MRDRAPWYRRRVGRLGKVVIALVTASAFVGFLGPRDGAWLALQWGLLGVATALYFVALVRSPD